MKNKLVLMIVIIILSVSLVSCTDTGKKVDFPDGIETHLPKVE